ncbi:hypothetical protein RHMOL_Rhmol04G0049800 [Rhododendron molle]|uniref:Uncharacterized protein n=1 Tax=Rhododendron molle TaxID=49168 RepID=A0ACC0NYA9_RHOML|nr:hypothetical protein RHMOL_Rhmol04G0049800 [Rhododendron molle]
MRFCPSDKHATFGIIVRNSEGEANYGRVKVSSALATEAGTSCAACSMAAKREAKDIIIETDCQPVVKMLNPGLCSRLGNSSAARRCKSFCG